MEGEKNKYDVHRGSVQSSEGHNRSLNREILLAGLSEAVKRGQCRVIHDVVSSLDKSNVHEIVAGICRSLLKRSFFHVFFHGACTCDNRNSDGGGT